MKKICLTLALVAVTLTLGAQNRVSEYVAQLAETEPFVSSVWGVMAVNMKGDTLVDFNSRQKMVPASNLKLITTGLALYSLGPEFCFETDLDCSGEIRDGVLDGDLYIVGKGDPTLDSTAFAGWKRILESKGISKIKGDIIADDRFYSSPADFEDWSYEDFESEDASGVTGLSFNHNYRDKAEPSYDNALNCARCFHEYLRRNGIEVKGEFYDSASYPDELLPVIELEYLGRTLSEPLKDIIVSTNHKSDNFYAEGLFRMMGRKFAQSDSYEDIRALEARLLIDLGLDISTGVVIRDGSGLSRKNYVSPDFFVRFLKRMVQTASFDLYLESLPQPGKGTLSSRMQSYPSSLKERVYMKSGSMNGIRCFSGYIISPDGKQDNTVAFSILTNNNTAPSGTVLSVIDRIVALMAE